MNGLLLDVIRNPCEISVIDHLNYIYVERTFILRKSLKLVKVSTFCVVRIQQYKEGEEIKCFRDDE